MKTARPRPNSTRKMRTRLSRTPGVSPPPIDDEDRAAFLTDKDNEVLADDELGDDGAKVSDQAPSVTVSCASVPAIGESSKDTAAEGLDEGDGSLGYFMDDAKKNKFIATLTKAARSYSSQLRVPVPSSVPPNLPRDSPAPGSPSPTSFGKVESDSAEGSGMEKESRSSTDTSDDAEVLSNGRRLTAQEAEGLFYLPSGPWTEFSNSPIENVVVLSKLYEGANCEAYIKRGDLGGRTITYISRTWNLSQKWQGFFSEMTLYSDFDYLRPLQGDVIPRIIGVYQFGAKVSIAMELPSPDFWVEANEEMSDELKRKCISAFDKIHDRGVLHNDVELRHMLISPKGEVTIIDFQESRALKALEEVGLLQATEADIRMEKRKIRFKLDYKDSRLEEVKKRKGIMLAGERVQQRGSNGERVLNSTCEYGSEPSGPADVLDPPVDSETFNREWVDELSTSRCYIVPDQDKIQVMCAVHDFLVDELKRLEKGDRPEMDEQDDTQAECSSSASISPSVSSVAPSIFSVSSPILPTRINLKRSRDESDEDPDDSPSEKRRRFVLKPNGTILAVPASPPAERIVTASTSTYVKRTPDPSSYLGSGELLVPDIYVPYEGYTGSGGSKIKNEFGDREVTSFRRSWIQRFNMRRAAEENLPYPTAELHSLAPRTSSKAIRYDRHGNIRKKKERPLVSLGALRRASLMPEEQIKRRADALLRKEKYFRDRCEPGTGLSDEEDHSAEEPNTDPSDNGIPEGPRILSWHELNGMSLDPTYCPESSPRSSFVSFFKAMSKRKAPTPLKSALRRHLTPEEKARNLEYFELKKRDESDSEDDGNVSSDCQRPTKRARTDDPQDILSDAEKLTAWTAKVLSSSGDSPPLRRSRLSSARATPPPANRIRSTAFTNDRPISSSPLFSCPPGRPNFAHRDSASDLSDGDKVPTSSAQMVSRRSLRSSQTTPDSETDSNTRDSPDTHKSESSSGLEKKQSRGSGFGISWNWRKN